MQHPQATMPTVLAGALPAAGASRAGATAVDVVLLLVAVSPLVIGLLSESAARAALIATGAVLVVGLLLAMWVSLARAGQTLGGALLGLRTVDALTGLPPGTGVGLRTWWRDTVTLDVRAGRDPLHDVAPDGTDAAPTTVPPPRGPRAAEPEAATRRAREAGPEAARGPREIGPDVAAARAIPTGATRAARRAGGPATGAVPLPATTRPATGSFPVVAAPPTTGAVPAVPAPAEPDGSRRSRRSQPPTGAIPVIDTPAAGAPAVSGMVLVAADGHRLEVTGLTLVGRNPEPVRGEVADQLVPLIDLSRSVSKTHASLRWDGRTLWVADRGSTNGTTVSVGGGARTLLPPGGEEALPVGTSVHFGDQTFTVDGPVGA
ncbi:RDD family protein [Cellulomonas sp.]|uniref:RDD family protein n=1 Tax=Cellulomonas sp. TaxID=40001 RepID=UPI003BADBA30